MIEEWIEYRKDDPATHPGFEGAYLVTILSKTGARYVEIRPFSFSSLFAGDWSRYSVQAWRPVPAAFGGTATAQQIAWGLTFDPFECATIMTGLKNLLDLYSELIKRIPSLAEVSACQESLNDVTEINDKISDYFETLQNACIREGAASPFSLGEDEKQ